MFVRVRASPLWTHSLLRAMRHTLAGAIPAFQRASSPGCSMSKNVDTIQVGSVRRRIKQSCVVRIEGKLIGVISRTSEITPIMRQHAITEESVGRVLAGMRRGDSFYCNGLVELMGTEFAETRLLHQQAHPSVQAVA